MSRIAQGQTPPVFNSESDGTRVLVFEGQSKASAVAWARRKFPGSKVSASKQRGLSPTVVVTVR